MRYPAAARFITAMIIVAASSTNCYAVTSTLTKHATAEDFQKGQTDGTVIGSDGTIRLGLASQQLWSALGETSLRGTAGQDDDVWAINRIVTAADGTIYAGTSPKGRILKYAGGKWTTIYPLEKAVDPNHPAADPNTSADPNAPADPNVPADVEDDRPATEHIYALVIDSEGRLLAAASGEKCRVIRFDGDSPVTVFEPNQAMYIFAMAFDAQRTLYLATGPQGKLYKIAPDGKSQVLYTATEKNLTCIAVPGDGYIYAGSDEKGRIYKINAATGSASVLYDADEAEVAALAFDEDGILYAAVSSEQAIKTTGAAPAGVAGAQPGKAPLQTGKEQAASREVRIAHMPTKETTAQEKPAAKPARPPRITTPSVIYRITKEGFVTKVFEQPVAFFDMAIAGGRLIAGTGNSAQLFAIDLATDERTELYAHKAASQITAVCPAGNEILVGTANTAAVVRIFGRYAEEARFDSPLVDADQPAMWGKLHIDAQIPDGTSILMSARSGNVSEVNDPTFSPWTTPVAMDGPAALVCPVARFCQYRLILKSDGKATPTVRQVAVASVVANLAPFVDSISIGPATATPLRTKEGLVKITIKARDDNKDTLTYKLEMRKLGRQKWIMIAEDLEKGEHEWDTRTVEDGRYEIQASASDRRSNTEATALEGKRVSDPVVIDNTPPQIMEAAVNVDAAAKTVTLRLRATDELSVISRAEYAIDSDKEWVGTLPDDSVFDEMSEAFTILAKDLEAGEHVIAVRLADAVGNTAYKTWDFSAGEEK